MKKLFTLLVIAVFATAAVGCEKNEESSAEGQEQTEAETEGEEAEAEKAEAPEEQPAETEDEAADGEKVAMVEVPADGKEYDPAVEKSRIPADTWICDMGTVHWAAKEKPEDGKCPICGMQLKKHEHAGDSAK
ncbi:MAG: hypothetical protein ACQEVA_12660 [Myxococcota bacterium]